MALLALVGDVMLDRLVNDVIATEPPEALWGDTLPLLSEADLRIANLECTISDRGRPFEPPRVFYFRAVPEAIDVVGTAGFDVLCQANNHALDYGEEALLDCLSRLEEAGVAAVGAGADRDRAWEPAVVEGGGLRMGVVAFADHYEEYAAGPDRPGIAWGRPGEEGTRRRLEQAVAEVRRRGAEFVVATVHWGPNMRRTPMPGFPAFARAALEAGVDLWQGHSAHLFQAVEYRDRGVILYDTGDFLDDYAVDARERNDRSLLYHVRVEGGRVAEVLAYPVELTVGHVRRAGEEAFAFVEGRLDELCAPFGTAVERRGDALALVPAG